MSKKSKAQKQSDTKQNLFERYKLIAGILLITFLAYANTLQNDWAYDDWFQVAKNQQVTSLSNIPKTFTQSVWQFLDESSRQPAGLYYRPIFNSFLILQYQLFGQKVWAWHLMSVLLHLIAVLLVYALAFMWNLNERTAAIAALIFGLHPVHVEAVAWISSSPDLIASVFVLASLLFYEKARGNESGAHNQLHRSWLCASLVFALLGMFSKEQTVMLTLFIFARELFEKTNSLKNKLSQSIFRASLFIIPALLYLTARFYVLGFIFRSYSNENDITFREMILTIPSVTLTYIRMLFVPYPLAIMYDHDYIQSIADTKFLLPLLILVIVFTFTIRLIKASSISLRAFAFLILFLLPVLNLRVFNQAESLVHDRYLYLPSIGFCLLIALGLNKLSERFTETKKFFIASTATISIIFFALTFFQNRTWRDDFALFNHALKFTPNKPFLYNALANSHTENNQFDEAEKFYRKAVEIDPKNYPAFSGLGFIYTKLQRYDDAAIAFQKVIEIGQPIDADYYNLGSAYLNLKRFDEAEKALLKAVEINPRYAPAHYNLGWLYKQRGQNDLAKKYYETAYTLQSQNLLPNQK